MDFDPRDIDSRDRDDFNIYDDRWLDEPRDQDDRERELERDHDPRDYDPREPFIEGLELPHGLERELVQDDRENLYELNGEDSRMLATIGSFLRWLLTAYQTTSRVGGHHASSVALCSPPSTPLRVFGSHQCLYVGR